MAARKKTSTKASKPEPEQAKPGGMPRKSKPVAARPSRVSGSAEKKPSLATDGADRPRGAEAAPVGGAASARAAPLDTPTAPAKEERASKLKAPEAPAVKAAGASATVRPAPEVPAKEETVRVSAAKESKAPSPTKSNERDEQGGEQKIMKNTGNRNGFKLNEFVVYPAHGVGQIVAMEEQEVAGFKLELFVINFTKDKMTLRVPTSKVTGVGMRKLSEPDVARRSLEILTGRARIKRTMWSRRAQEYEAKINSGDINAIAEVVRDLFRSEAQPEQSYSERQLYEAALDRMMREIAAVQKLTDTEALKVIETQLMKNQKRTPKPDAAEGEEPDVEEAA
jgi:CarD family transcriptional regulator